MDDEVAESVPLLTLSTPHIGHFQIRTRGTLGGAIAHADPGRRVRRGGARARRADRGGVPTRTKADPGRRVLHRPVGDVAASRRDTHRGARSRCGRADAASRCSEFARRHGDFAIAGATVAVELDADDRVTRCGIGLLGLGSTPKRGTQAEEAITGRTVTDISAEEIGRLAMSGLDDVPADLQGSASYRTRVGATMVARAWTEAITEALNA